MDRADLTPWGAVLAGGKSSRFGRDKASFVWKGRPLISYVIEAARQAVPVVMVVTGRPGRLPPLDRDIIVVADEPPGLGPMGGLTAALSRAGGRPVLCLACDMPWAPAGLLKEIARERTWAPVVAPEGEKGPEPLCALYHPSLLPLLQASIRAGCLSLKRLFRLIPLRLLARERWVRYGPHVLQSANTLEHLEAVGGETGPEALRP